MTSTGTGGPTTTGDAGSHHHSVSAHIHTSGDHRHTVSSGSSYTGWASPSTQSGGGGDTGNAGSHSHSIEQHAHGMNHTHNINGSVTIPGISIDIPSHTHSVSIPNHTHSVSIPAHTHEVEIPNHTHGIVYGIYKGPRASAYAVEVDGVRVPDGVFSGGTGDIAPYLSKDADGRIRRGVFHALAIRPLAQEGNENGLCHIRASWNAQVFISSLMGVQL